MMPKYKLQDILQNPQIVSNCQQVAMTCRQPWPNSHSDRFSIIKFNTVACAKFVQISSICCIPLRICASRTILSAYKRQQHIRDSHNRHQMLSVRLWHCWLGGRKGIQPVKSWVVGCWRGYLSGVRCRFAYGPAYATATHYLLLQ